LHKQWPGQRFQHLLPATVAWACAPGSHHRVHHPPAKRQHVPAVRPRVRAVAGVLRVPGLHRPAGAVPVYRRAALPADVQPGRLHNRSDRRRGTGQHRKVGRGHDQRQAVAVQDEGRQQLLLERGHDEM